MMETVVKGAQIDRLKMMDELKSIIDSDDMELISQVDREEGSFSITLKIPIADANFDSVSRFIAMTVDAAL